MKKIVSNISQKTIMKILSKTVILITMIMKSIHYFLIVTGITAPVDTGRKLNVL